MKTLPFQAIRGRMSGDNRERTFNSEIAPRGTLASNDWHAQMGPRESFSLHVSLKETLNSPDGFLA